MNQNLRREVQQSANRHRCEARTGHDFKDTGEGYTFPNGDQGRELVCVYGCGAAKILPLKE